MKKLLTFVFITALNTNIAMADSYNDAIESFESADATQEFFDTAYGYALFPTVGKGGFWVGGAYGEGRVYEQGNHVGNANMIQVTLGFQLGGQAYSQIIFFEDKRSFDEFTNGNFEFSAQANATVITANASAEAGTKGLNATASGGKNNVATSGQYYKGMATFIVVKGGLMYKASIGGQKFGYTAN